ncbi:MAG TPA: protein kinase [Blastocatellia bacterium]|nr:protein kinase [Blastocatellia bacterium]
MTCRRCGSENQREGHFCRNCGSSLAAPEASATVIAPPPSPSNSTMIGRTIEGRYHIDSLLDQGGMGVVYRATRVMIGDVVALKVMHSDKVADADSRERFRREAQAAARLKHPNAVAIHDFGVTSDQLVYLVMELVEGESLAKIIQRRGALPPAECIEIMRQVTAAVGEAHRHNIVHRDLKPDNIIVCGSGSQLQVKVLDFGIAKLKDVQGTTLTQAGTVVGTPYYMSPEQCLGEELDGRSDIYSLGVVLFEMLTGKVPFSAPTPTAVVIQQVTQPAPSPRASNPSISLSIERVVMRSLEKKREARPATAELFYQELSVAAVAQGQGIFPGSSASDANTVVQGQSQPQIQPMTGLGPTVVQGSQPGTQESRGQAPTQTPGAIPAGTGAPYYPQPQAPASGGYPASTGQPVPGSHPGYPSVPQQPAAPRPSQPQLHSSPQPYPGGYGSGPQPGPGAASFQPGRGGGVPYPPPNPSMYMQAQPRRKSRAGLYIVISFLLLAAIIVAIAIGYYAATDDSKTGPSTSPTPAYAPADPASTPTPETPTPSPKQPVNLDSVVVEVNNTLNGWAQAITSRNMSQVMSYYSDTLQPYYRMPVASADRARSEINLAFAEYSITEVEVDNVAVAPTADGLHASVTFDKRFQFSGTKAASGAVQEQMWFMKIGGRWMITGVKDLQVY